MIYTLTQLLIISQLKQSCTKGRFSVPHIKEKKGIIFMNAIRRTPACRPCVLVSAKSSPPAGDTKKNKKIKKRQGETNLSIQTHNQVYSLFALKWFRQRLRSSGNVLSIIIEMSQLECVSEQVGTYSRLSACFSYIQDGRLFEVWRL